MQMTLGYIKYIKYIHLSPVINNLVKLFFHQIRIILELILKSGTGEMIILKVLKRDINRQNSLPVGGKRIGPFLGDSGT